VSEEPTWRDLVTRLDDGGDDRHIFERIFRCDVDSCPKDSIKGEGPTKQHVETAHKDLLRPGPRGADPEPKAPRSSDDKLKAGGQPAEDSPTPDADTEPETRPSRWAGPDLDLEDRPKPRRDAPDEDDPEQDNGHRDDRPPEEPERRQPTPEEFVPVAQAFRERLDHALVARGAEPGDLPPEAFRENVDLEGARVLAKYMPTYGAEINLGFMLLVGYGPTIWQLRKQHQELDEDEATERGMDQAEIQRAQEPEAEVSAGAKQEFLEALA